MAFHSLGLGYDDERGLGIYDGMILNEDDRAGAVTSPWE